MIPYSILPHTNALLNATSATLLVIGYIFIRKGNKDLHHRSMISAFVTSLLFFACYLIYHARMGTTRFAYEGWVRVVYLSILLSHTLLAVAVVPLALIVLSLGSKGRFSSHKRIARWALPIWFYVSATGIIVYLMLYHL